MFSLREMKAADIEAGLRLCRASGWNQLRRDWELFLSLSPHGCRVAVTAEQVVGTVATVNYENRFGWIAMVLVDSAARGNGVAKVLMNEALVALKDTGTLRLDATPAGHRVYRKLGFVDEYGLSRMATIVAPNRLPALSPHARPMTREDWPAICNLDREIFGADRRALLEWMLADAPDYAWVKQEREQITGYCFGRHGHNAEHLGPVIAHDQNTARELVTACLYTQSGKPFLLDATPHNAAWRAWLESIGFSEQRQFMRMYRGENSFPGLPEKQFGITGPEFG